MSIDKFLRRVPRKGYNCFDFAREVWLDLQGEDIAERFPGLKGSFDQRKANPSGMRGIKRLKSPVSPCFVLMQRSQTIPHIGVYWKGRVLHLNDKGAQYQPLNIARGYFPLIRFYK